VLVAVVIVIACAGKIIGCGVGARLAGLTRRESSAIGFGMVARGAMEVILGQIAYEAGLIREELFATIVIMALFTTMIAGPLMRRALRLNEPARLQSVLSERSFVARMRARRRREAIAELARCAERLTTRSRREIFHSVWKQERIVPTGLEHGIAVPHARMAGLTRSYAIIGLSEHGIDFDAADGEPSRIICLLLTPIENHTAQIELLNMVARAFHSEQARREVLDSRSFTEFLAALTVTARGRR
jgi:mannitol/fructose-specific phosphotransferase system IIA component (Ntr-type)